MEQPVHALVNFGLTAKTFKAGDEVTVTLDGVAKSGGAPIESNQRGRGAGQRHVLMRLRKARGRNRKMRQAAAETMAKKFLRRSPSRSTLRALPFAARDEAPSRSGAGRQCTTPHRHRRRLPPPAVPGVIAPGTRVQLVNGDLRRDGRGRSRVPDTAASFPSPTRTASRDSTRPGTASTFVEVSNNANGLGWDTKGRLIAVERKPNDERLGVLCPPGAGDDAWPTSTTGCRSIASTTWSSRRSDARVLH